jgi:putative transposase
MQKVEQHIIKDNRFKDWCVKAKNLYNQSLYYWRQSIFGNIQYFSEYELTGLFAEFNEENFRALPSNTSQQIIKFLFKNINSWQRARKEYVKNPSKFLGKPKLPKYKKELSELYFTNIQVRLKDGFAHFPKMMNVEPIKTKVTNINCCRVIPKSNHFVVEFVYTIEDIPQKEFNDKWMGIDIGLNNIATCSSNVIEPFIINGKPLKAVNSFYNKRKKQLQSNLKANTFTSKRIERLTFRRNQKIKDYIHKASRKIVDLAKENDITKIIIGKNDNWKQSINLGRKTNRQFNSIPHATLIEKIKYKAQLEGIEVVVTQEAYTSKCSAIDLERIGKHESYVGKRKKRGLFITANGKLINADVNGSLNIARLVLGDGIIKHDSIMSCLVQPVKINNFDKQKNIRFQDLIEK